MTNVGYATLTVIPSAKGFSKALSGDVDPAMRGAGKSGGALLGGGIGAAAAAVLGPAALGLGAVFVGGFVKSAVDAAGALEQSIGAVDAVFKDSSSQVHGWAQSAAMDVGLTRNEFNELGTLIGSQLKNGGTAMDELAPKTHSLIGLGADLSSMFGGTTKEAVEALSSALKGERDPIEKYGVSLNEAKIQAEIAAQAARGLTFASEEQAKQAATLALIMNQTTDAHGNFAKEADTLAGKQQRINALWQDGKARLGEAFLPAVSAGAGALLGVMGPAIDLVAAIGLALTSVTAPESIPLGAPGAGIASALAAVLPVIRVYYAELYGAVAMIFDAAAPLREALVDGLGAAARALAPAFVTYYATLAELAASLPIASILATLLGAYGGYLVTAVAAVVPLVTTLVSTLSGVLVAVLPTIVSAVAAVAALLAPVATAISTILVATLPLVAALVAQLAPIFAQLAADALPVAVAVLALVSALLPPVAAAVRDVLAPTVEALLPVVEAVLAAVAAVISAAMTIIQGIIEAVSALIRGDWDAFWAAIGTILSGVWNLIVSLIQGAVGLLSAAVAAIVDLVGALWEDGWSDAVSTIGSLWDGIVSGFADWIDGLVGMGEDMIRGLVDGFASMADAIAEAILGPLGGMVDGVKDFLGIHSPSRTFMEHGEEAAEAFVPSAVLYDGPGVAPRLRNRERSATYVSFDYLQQGGAGFTSADELRRGARIVTQALD